LSIQIEFDTMTGRKIYVAPDGKRFASMREAELYERQRSTRSAWKSAQFSNVYGAGQSKVEQQIDLLAKQVDMLNILANKAVADRDFLDAENRKLEAELADRDELMETEFDRLEKSVQSMIDRNTGLQEQVAAWQEDSEEKGDEIVRLEGILADLSTYVNSPRNFNTRNEEFIQNRLQQILRRWQQ
jgi:regulator of replication initiation timing